MALVPWRAKSSWGPFYELESIPNGMNKLFNLSFSRWPERETSLMKSFISPAIDIVDTKDNIIVKADIPGMKKDDLEVSVERDTLVIKGEKKQESEVKEKDYIRSERFYGSFNRAIPLSTEIDTTKVSATYKNGVLELTLPKKEGAKPKSIKVDIK